MLERAGGQFIPSVRPHRLRAAPRGKSPHRQVADEKRQRPGGTARCHRCAATKQSLTSSAHRDPTAPPAGPRGRLHRHVGGRAVEQGRLGRRGCPGRRGVHVWERWRTGIAPAGRSWYTVPACRTGALGPDQRRNGGWHCAGRALWSRCCARSWLVRSCRRCQSWRRLAMRSLPRVWLLGLRCSREVGGRRSRLRWHRRMGLLGLIRFGWLRRARGRRRRLRILVHRVLFRSVSFLGCRVSFRSFGPRRGRCS